MTIRNETWFVQKKKGECMFFCKSEWDGDVFTSDPYNAEKLREPWVKRGFDCEKIYFLFITYEEHQNPHHVITKKGRHSLTCPRCKIGTGTYAKIESATEKYKVLTEAKECIRR